MLPAKDIFFEQNDITQMRHNYDRKDALFHDYVS